jgi:hypothetical protein
LKIFFWGGASPGSAGCFKKPTQIPNAGHPIYITKNYFYIKIIFSGCVTGTPVNFGGITGRAQAVILK